MSDLVGCRIGDFQVLRRLGSGGMADVYAARQLALGRDVALKVLRSVAENDDDHLKRFRREAQAAARLNHPSIVQIYEFGEIDGVHFIAQELVDGINLKQAVDREGPFSADQAVKVLRSVGNALQVAHAGGVTHRDIKPENIMRGAHDVIKVTDFGLARMLTQADSSTANLTRAGLTLGTPRYMSPEQIQGGKVDARSDLYSLGVTMYHLLTGSAPFDGDEALALAVKHLHDTPRPIDHVRGKADLPAWLVSLVMRCLQKAPEARVQSATELLQIVQTHSPESSSSIEMPAARPRSREAQGKGGPSEPMAETTQSPAITSQTAAVTTQSDAATTASSGTVSSATIELQRVVDSARQNQSRQQSRHRLTLVAVVLASLVSGVGGWMAAQASRPRSIASELRGPIVAVADTIEQQYLTALTRNDAPAWQAVLDFPIPPDSPQSDYHDKAKLQLARLYIEQGDYPAASRILDELQQSTSVKRLYLLLAKVERHTIAMITGDQGRASRLKTQINDNFAELSVANPAAAQQFRRIVPESERLNLGLVEGVN
ncbi:serine/threonine protein kinase [Allorhodopirellula solitaria]|uniref:non-specific serine/threonine protein kinase n=1 Tax=Allorhodopirellula solitaria TaxID=2527987 RepID=A0A5C5XWK2_9BACT|nr:serine/threonine-protein kinase [Allorhodopirellula solitaria]TWT67310.1 Serine/threonine-protein kinase PrkC [Allorhodopirellula solitaria]